MIYWLQLLTIATLARFITRVTSTIRRVVTLRAIAQAPFVVKMAVLVAREALIGVMTEAGTTRVMTFYALVILLVLTATTNTNRNTLQYKLKYNECSSDSYQVNQKGTQISKVFLSITVLIDWCLRSTTDFLLSHIPWLPSYSYSTKSKYSTKLHCFCET